MVNMIDNDGNPVRLGAGQPKPTQADFNALLLRAVQKGWTIYEWEGAIGHKKGEFLLQLHRPIIQYWLKPDTNGLPACPDAETYQRIRIAVEGQ